MDKEATGDHIDQIDLILTKETKDHKPTVKGIDQKSSFLNFVLESLPHPFYVIDASNHKIILANAAAIKVGLSEGTTCHVATHSSKRPCGLSGELCPLEIIKETKAPMTAEHLHYDQDGNPRNVAVYAYPIFDAAGEISHIIEYTLDITDRKRALETLKYREKELAKKAEHLNETNTALKVLLKRREVDRKELEERVLYNVNELVEPYIKKLKNSKLDDNQKSFLDIIESNLNNIVATFTPQLSNHYLRFTPTEIKIANLIKLGKTTKDIAGMLNLSPRTVEFHRDNIRKKIGIKNRKINLRTRLLSLQQSS
jgi:DNA-binding CsgD family transcriptional regulator